MADGGTLIAAAAAAIGLIVGWLVKEYLPKRTEFNHAERRDERQHEQSMLDRFVGLFSEKLVEIGQQAASIHQVVTRSGSGNEEIIRLLRTMQAEDRTMLAEVRVMNDLLRRIIGAATSPEGLLSASGVGSDPAPAQRPQRPRRPSPPPTVTPSDSVSHDVAPDDQATMTEE